MTITEILNKCGRGSAVTAPQVKAAAIVAYLENNSIEAERLALQYAELTNLTSAEAIALIDQEARSIRAVYEQNGEPLS